MRRNFHDVREPLVMIVPMIDIMLFLLVLGLLFTGPGRWSLDFSRSWVRRPLASSWIFAFVGIGGLVAIWWFLAGTF